MTRLTRDRIRPVTHVMVETNDVQRRRVYGFFSSRRVVFAFLICLSRPLDIL